MVESEVANKLKSNSSKWLNEQGLVRGRFGWQDGFAAVTVSPSQLGRVKEYIQHQRKRHATLTFEEEYRLFVEKNRAQGNDADLVYLLG